jgi:magnesium transporter
LIGVIYASDVIDVMAEEAEEDILLLGGVKNNNLHLSSYLTAKSRIPWLFTSLITTSMAVIIIALFSGEIQKIVALAVLMPIVASLAGNAGNQALTVLVRSIATDEINNIGAAKILIKEVLVGSLNGLILSIIAGISCYVWKHNLYLSLVLASSMLLTVILAGFAGASIPLFLNKMKFDPAVSSGVFLIAITDTSSFLIFLGLASLFLN